MIKGIDTIIEKSIEIISEEGYASFTTKNLADRLKIAKASLYHWITGMEELKESIYEKKHEEVMKAPLRLKLTDNLEEMLLFLSRHWVALYSASGHFHYLRMLLQLRLFDPRAEEEYQALLDMLSAQVSVIFDFYGEKNGRKISPLSPFLFCAMLQKELEDGLMYRESGDLESKVRAFALMEQGPGIASSKSSAD